MISLRSKIAQKMLNFLLLNKEEKFYINELAKLLGEDPSNLYKKLLEFKKEGLLLDEFQGKERFFFLNKKYPFLKEYEKIILKGFGFEKILKDKLKSIKGVESVYIFGSYVKNHLSSESDIDLLIIGDFDTLKLQKALLEIQKSTGREINSIELTKKEFEKKKREKDYFIENIFSGKIIKII
ncbi:MAG: nucleotidyltransferase domain-containing protein [Candidatus Terrybacteria bacterium]|nr:nucleotidyltransferase domain-containing protein [Candidatus Terrybacteria bacterium]